MVTLSGISIYQTSKYLVFMHSDWLLKLEISCDIHWFAKHNRCVHIGMFVVLSSRFLGGFGAVPGFF